MVSVREAGMHEKGFRDAFIGGKTGEGAGEANRLALQ